MGVVVSAGKAFTPAPAGVHPGVCCDVVDLGMVTSQWEGKKTTKHKVRVVWQIGEIHPETQKPFIVSKRYTASLHEKAALRKDLQSWRGRPFTNEELKAFDLDAVVGANALLNIVQVEKDGSTYANVDAIMPVPKGTAKLVVRDYIRDKDRPKDDLSDPSQFEAADDFVPF